MLISETGQKKHNRAVILTGDENVVDYARFVFWQIAKNEPDRDYDLVFCTPVKGLEAGHPHLPEIRTCEISTTKLEAIPTRPSIPIACHIKVALPEIFRNDYEQIIYLDTDVYLRHGKLSDLFTLASTDKPVSAILDGIQWRDVLYESVRKSWTAMGIQNTRYFNAGVLVYNVEAYCQADIMAGVITYASENRHLFSFTDQDASNGYLRGDWHPLPPEWNWQGSETPFRLIPEFNPHLLHFVGTTKPYLTKTTRFTKQYRNTYVDFFEHVLEKAFVPIDRPANAPQGARKKRMSLQSVVTLINKINPLAYTPLYNYVDVRFMRSNIRKIQAGVQNRTALWPPDARNSGEPET